MKGHVAVLTISINVEALSFLVTGHKGKQHQTNGCDL